MTRDVTKKQLVQQLAVIINFLTDTKHLGSEQQRDYLGGDESDIQKIRGLFKPKTAGALPRFQSEVNVAAGEHNIEAITSKDLLFGGKNHSTYGSYSSSRRNNQTIAYGAPMIACATMAINVVGQMNPGNKDDIALAIGTIIDFIKQHEGSNLRGFQNLRDKYFELRGMDSDEAASTTAIKRTPKTYSRPISGADAYAQWDDAKPFNFDR